MPDYNKNSFSWKEKLLSFGMGSVAAGVIAWLFYHSIYGLIYLPVCVVFAGRELKKYRKNRRQQEIQYQFQGMLRVISALLTAGYSMENAFREGAQDFARQYGKECIMYRELVAINHRMEMNIPIESLLEDLAERSGIEEIDSFSQVFGFAKRGGGDIVKIFKDSAEKLAEKAEVRREIETVIAAKKLEQKIMAVVPCGILVYVRVGMPEFLSPLYGNPTGILVMSVCLGIYAAAFQMAQRIVEIQV